MKTSGLLKFFPPVFLLNLNNTEADPGFVERINAGLIARILDRSALRAKLDLSFVRAGTAVDDYPIWLEVVRPLNDFN